MSDESNGRPLPGVHVLLLQDGDLVSGEVTNRDGVYVLSQIEPGAYEFRASFVGYLIYSDTFILSPGETLAFNIGLVSDPVEHDEVLVQSERTHGAARVTAGMQTIRPSEIELIPGPDLSGDLAAYLTTLPGIVSMGDRGGQLFVRGGEPSHNMVRLDGMLIYQPFHILGFYSAFPSDILSEVDVYAGGFGSRFSGRVSSVIDAYTRNGNKHRYASTFTASPFVSSAMVEGPLFSNRVSILASIRQSMLQQGAERLLNQSLPFNFGDAFAKVHADVTAGSQASISFLRTHDRGTILPATDRVESQHLQWRNMAIGARYLILPSALPIRSDLRLAYSSLHTAVGPATDPDRLSDVGDFQAAGDFAFFNRGGQIDAGVSIRIVSMENELGGDFQETHRSRADPIHFAFYIEPDIKIGSHLRVRPGLVMESLQTKGFPFFEPRLRVVWARGRHQLSGAGGYFIQEIVGLNDRRDATSVFTAWTLVVDPERYSAHSQRDGRVLAATHALLGYRVQPLQWLEFSVEGYHKWLSQLLIPEWSSYVDFTTRQQHARGQSSGLDLRLELRRNPFYGYLNYGLSSTVYEAYQPGFQYWYGEESVTFSPPHDRTHQVNMLASTRLFGLALSARWQFGSGLPFSQIMGFDGYVELDGPSTDIRDRPGVRRIIYDHPFEGRLPAYHRLDLSVERSFELEHGRLTLQASILNAYNRANILYLDVFTFHRVDQLPLIPSFGIRLAFE